MQKKLIKGVYELNSKIFKDERGSFLSCFKNNETIYTDNWLDRKINQINISNTSLKGSIRGLHYQENPYSECKIIRCIRGKVWDVAVDLRKESSTYKKWVAIQLCSKKNNAIIIPEGCAHGFQTLENNCELLYIHSENYHPNSEKGIRWDDPIINVSWPLPLTQISLRDQSLPFYSEE
tara:strand:+ start:4647 stop:5180 length:534 start_codon:yes stop_codon:yes gene_type:complete